MKALAVLLLLLLLLVLVLVLLMLPKLSLDDDKADLLPVVRKLLLVVEADAVATVEGVDDENGFLKREAQPPPAAEFAVVFAAVSRSNSSESTRTEMSELIEDDLLKLLSESELVLVPVLRPYLVNRTI